MKRTFENQRKVATVMLLDVIKIIYTSRNIIKS